MGVAEILEHIDQEIAKLERARALLSGASKTAKTHQVRVARRKSNLSPEGRKRIADAVKRRWERQRKAANGK